MHIITDPAVQLAPIEVLSPRAFAANANSTVIDLKSFQGKVAFVLHSAAATAGTSPTVDARIMVSAESNGANAINAFDAIANANVAFTQVTNATAGAEVKSVDVRSQPTGYRYAKIVSIIGGTNSPSFPLSAVAYGQRKTI